MGIIMTIVSVVLVILIAKNKKAFKSYKKEIEGTMALEAVELEKKKSTLENEVFDLNKNIQSLTNHKASLEESITLENNKIATLEKQVERLENNKELVVEYGFYKPIYSAMSSGEYSNLIDAVRNKQKEMVSRKTAIDYCDSWVVEGSKKEGEKMTNDNIKLMLRAFNYECDTIISKIKYNNFEASEKKIKKSAEAINKLGYRNKIKILDKYVALKIEEAHLCYEYSLAVQEEKEKLREAKAEEKERLRAEKELAEARKKLEKEMSHYENAKNDILTQIANCKTTKEKSAFEAKLAKITSHIDEISKSIKDVDYREANNKAGYVYVISNEGSFGKDVYKIGMTRRLDPMDRVDELGDASVPFKFDVHAMIFSDNAPALEAALHDAFDNKKVNMVNGRKEFFNVSLEEIEAVVKKNHDKAVKFTYEAEAQQYRESMKMKSN